MSFRTVVIKNRCKLDLSGNYLVRRAEDEKKIFIKEISCLIVESTAVSLTACLLSELVKNNVKIIFCDEKHNPESELIPYRNNYISSKRISLQINWDKRFLSKLWREIVKEKILKQARVLEELHKIEQANMLKEYAENVENGDSTNREGHSAKVYFNAVFGKDFERREEDKINSALNYGYSILLSCFNREITSRGYLTQLGIWHKNDFNAFNLSCDLMEPFRTLIDKMVIDFTSDQFKNYKMSILEIFNKNLQIKGKKYAFEDAISIYCTCVLDAIESKNLNKVCFYEG